MWPLTVRDWLYGGVRRHLADAVFDAFFAADPLEIAS